MLDAVDLLTAIFEFKLSPFYSPYYVKEHELSWIYIEWFMEYDPW